jgi:hypothetical protein
MATLLTAQLKAYSFAAQFIIEQVASNKSSLLLKVQK